MSKRNLGASSYLSNTVLFNPVSTLSPCKIMIPFSDPCKKCLVRPCCKHESSWNWCEPKHKYDNTKPDLGVVIILMTSTVFLITVLIGKFVS